MNKLIAIVGASGVGKTSLVRALAKAYAFETAYEEHTERPFQALFKQDARYALANQIDYLLRCAEQERLLRLSPRIGLMDGGLDLDFHGFTRLFHSRGMLTDPEFELCRRLYLSLREALPAPEMIVHLCADEQIIAKRLSRRDRINIAGAEDSAQLDSFLREWLTAVPSSRVLELDVSDEMNQYEESVRIVLDKIGSIAST
jgi:deoxyadenosine/deoxycytidine kinase